MAKFFARPDLSDTQFKQNIDSSLTLSGTTNFSGVLESKGVIIDASLTNATGATVGSNYVFTLVNDKIQLAPSVGGSGGSVLFNSNKPTTRAGVPSVNVNGTTIQDFLNGYFFPSVIPSSTLSISTGGYNRQFGDGTTGLLAWTATKNTNPITQILIDAAGSGTSFNISVIPTGGNQNGTTSYALTLSDYTPPLSTLQISRTYRISVTTATETSAIVSASITWRHNRFYFKSNTSFTNTDTIAIQNILNNPSLSVGELSTSKAKTFTPITFSSEYFYYAYPAFFGVPSFTVNGLPNNAWGNTVNGTLFTISYTNSNGYVETFYVAKSDQRMSNTFNIAAI